MHWPRVLLLYANCLAQRGDPLAAVQVLRCILAVDKLQVPARLAAQEALAGLPDDARDAEPDNAPAPSLAAVVDGLLQA